MKIFILTSLLTLALFSEANESFCEEYGTGAIIETGTVYGLQKSSNNVDCNYSINGKMVFAEGDTCGRLRNGSSVKHCLRETEGSDLYDFLAEDIQIFE